MINTSNPSVLDVPATATYVPVTLFISNTNSIFEILRKNKITVVYYDFNTIKCKHGLRDTATMLKKKLHTVPRVRVSCLVVAAIFILLTLHLAELVVKS